MEHTCKLSDNAITVHVAMALGYMHAFALRPKPSMMQYHNKCHSPSQCSKLTTRMHAAIPCADPAETLRVNLNCLSVDVRSSVMKLISPASSATVYSTGLNTTRATKV